MYSIRVREMICMDCIRFMCCVKDNRKSSDSESENDDVLVVNANSNSSIWSSIRDKISEWSLPQRQDTVERIRRFDEYLALETTREMTDQGFSDHGSVVSVNSDISQIFD